MRGLHTPDSREIVLPSGWIAGGRLLARPLEDRSKELISKDWECARAAWRRQSTRNISTEATPGVYITEIAAFGTSIVGVQTAVPAFVGYTEFAGDPTTGASLYNTPLALSSMAEFQQFFGGAFVQPAWITQLQPTPSASASGGSTPSGSGAA